MLEEPPGEVPRSPWRQFTTLQQTVASPAQASARLPKNSLRKPYQLKTDYEPLPSCDPPFSVFSNCFFGLELLGDLFFGHSFHLF